MSEKNTQAITEVKQQIQKLRGNIGLLNNKIQALSSHNKTLEDMPVTLDDFKKYLKANIDHHGAKFIKSSIEKFKNEKQRKGLQNISWSSLEHHSKKNPDRLLWELDLLYADPQQLFMALCAIFPDEITDRLSNLLGEEFKDEWSSEMRTPITQRKNTIENNKTEILKLEQELEDNENELQAITNFIN